MRSKLLSLLVLCFLVGCTGQFAGDKPGLAINNESYKLDNGLEVILHEDRSDPIVAVAIVYHVGSNRETKGRTGFAHLFEHMLFQESQHVGQDQFFKKIQDAGGTLNGGTWQDGTVYFEIVPKNALEMVLWLESDRMGYLLSTVTQDAFENQQEVVQNEKRQRVDNRPYGHTGYVIDKNIYPEEHPYNWQVIGELEDLQNATLEDVKDFYMKWYGPNNATMVIAGDYDKAKVKQWVEKYFNEIESPNSVTDRDPMRVALQSTKRVFHEDNFAKSPELNMVFPSVEEYDRDAYALSLFSDLFADGKKAPLYRVIVEEEKLAPSVSAFQSSSELAGYFRVRIRAFPDKSLTDVEKAIATAMSRFEAESFSDEDLSRIKAKLETGFYNGMSSVFNKAYQLASYNEYAGSPDFLNQDLQNYLDVTREDIMRVYNTYLKDKNYVLTSFVPKGKTELVAENSERFPIVEEAIVEMKEGSEKSTESEEIAKIPSSFDRTVEPAKGPSPQLTIPSIWQDELDNGIRVLGIEHHELPLIQVSMTLQGGMILDDPNKIGVANLMTDIMMEGTRNKTPIELEEAIDALGSSINMSTGKTSINIRANMLASKFDETLALIEEILLEPRWDEKEFARIKEETIETINRRKTVPSAIVGQVFDKLVYGGDHILANASLGTAESVAEITIDDQKRFYESNFSPSLTHVSIAGDISQSTALNALSSLAQRWAAKSVEIKPVPAAPAPNRAALYFVDVPNAKQSEIRIGYSAPAATDPDYYPAYVMNYKLGGSFNGILNLILREEKGYTYGARSGFSGDRHSGAFAASSSVRSNATYESMVIFKDELNRYREPISADDLQFTKNALIQSNARRFETLGALMGMLNSIANYDWPVDYIKQREAIVRDMTVAEHNRLAQKYIDPDKMIFLVVGDAKTQMAKLGQLGLGKPILLDTDGNRIGAGVAQLQ